MSIKKSENFFIMSNHRFVTASMPSASQPNLPALIVCLAGTTPQPPASPIMVTMVISSATVTHQRGSMRVPTAKATQSVVG